MATEFKTLNELLHEKVAVLPKYLVVGTEQNGYFDINEGHEVYSTDAKGIKRQSLKEDGSTLEDKGYVVEHDADNNRIFYIPNQHKSPYTGKGAVEVAIQAGDNANRAMLELFGEYVKGRFDFGVTVFATDIIATVETVPED